MKSDSGKGISLLNILVGEGQRTRCYSASFRLAGFTTALSGVRQNNRCASKYKWCALRFYGRQSTFRNFLDAWLEQVQSCNHGHPRNFGNFMLYLLYQTTWTSFRLENDHTKSYIYIWTTRAWSLCLRSEKDRLFLPWTATRKLAQHQRRHEEKPHIFEWVNCSHTYIVVLRIRRSRRRQEIGLDLERENNKSAPPALEIRGFLHQVIVSLVQY